MVGRVSWPRAKTLISYDPLVQDPASSAAIIVGGAMVYPTPATRVSLDLIASLGRWYALGRRESWAPQPRTTGPGRLGL